MPERSKATRLHELGEELERLQRAGEKVDADELAERYEVDADQVSRCQAALDALADFGLSVTLEGSAELAVAETRSVNDVLHACGEHEAIDLTPAPRLEAARQT